MSLCGAILPHHLLGYNHYSRAKFNKFSPPASQKGVQIIHMSQINVFLKRTIVVLLWLAGLYIFFRWLLLALLPFLLALGLAAIMEPLVQQVRRRLRVRRSFASSSGDHAPAADHRRRRCTATDPPGIGAPGLSSRLPEAVEQFPQLWNGMLDKVDSWYTGCPVFLRSALDGMAQQLMEEGPSLGRDRQHLADGGRVRPAGCPAGYRPFCGNHGVGHIFYQSLLPRHLVLSQAAAAREVAKALPQCCPVLPLYHSQMDAGGASSDSPDLFHSSCRIYLDGPGLRSAGRRLHRPGGRPAGTGGRGRFDSLGHSLPAAGKHRSWTGPAGSLCGNHAHPLPGGAKAPSRGRRISPLSVPYLPCT